MCHPYKHIYECFLWQDPVEDLGREAFEFTMGDDGIGEGEAEGGGTRGQSSLEGGNGEKLRGEEEKIALDSQVGFALLFVEILEDNNDDDYDNDEDDDNNNDDDD